VSALFVIARDDPRDAALARDAERLGWSVLRLRLLETEPGADRGRFLDWLQALPPAPSIAWTSRRAAAALTEIALPRFRETLARMPLFALGEESAAPTRDAGIVVEVCPDGRGAATLAEWIIRRRDAIGITKVAFLHGDKALPTLPDALRAAKLEVVLFELYRTRFLSPDVGGLTAALEAGRPVTAAYWSPSGVDALERLLSPGAVSALRESSEALPRGGTTYQALVDRGYRRARSLLNETRAFDSIALEALQSGQRTAQ
jgi:uroporphyrinogen-III synthase